jgi:hypothetical protein
MNKSEVLTTMKHIEKKLKNNLTVSFMEHTNVTPFRVLYEMWIEDKRQFLYEGVQYNFVYNPFHTTHGNRSTTPEFEVKRYSKKEMYDVDELLKNKEIEVRDWMGGTNRIDQCGLDKLNDEYKYPYEKMVLNQILEAIMDNTNYSVMIDRYGTGDVVVWIDDKRFKQR